MANYIEYIYSLNSTNSLNSNIYTCDINIPEEKFIKLLDIINTRYHNPFEKTFKCYMQSDLVMENYAKVQAIRPGLVRYLVVNIGLAELLGRRPNPYQPRATP